jgi:hypothetical protein
VFVAEEEVLKKTVCALPLLDTTSVVISGLELENCSQSKEPAIMSMHGKDVSGNEMAVLPMAVVELDGVAVEQKDGHYFISRLLSVGQHTVTVKVDDKHVGSSPYTLTVDQQVLDPTLTKVSGVEDSNQSREPCSLIVSTKDLCGNPFKTAAVAVSVKAPKESYDSEVKDNGDGSFSALYKRETPGV